MKKILLLTTALLVGAIATGAALATPRLLEDHIVRWSDRDDDSAVSDSERFHVADRDHRRRHESRERRREHHDDDEDDDDRGGRGRAGRPGMTGPSDPAAPVPDNGLFRGKVRPKVEVN
ncbi:MAG: hypothetical protein OEL76_17135 [Siculibacillus sp.]|nr:hypothetical protein [Siculibacillus sp.]